MLTAEVLLLHDQSPMHVSGTVQPSACIFGFKPLTILSSTGSYFIYLKIRQFYLTGIRYDDVKRLNVSKEGLEGSNWQNSDREDLKDKYVKYMQKLFIR